MATRSDTANALIALLQDRPVAYHPMLAKILGGVKEAIFVSQLLYWHGKGSRPDGFIWKTREEFQEETGLTRYEQETARRHLRDLGVLEEKRKGVPGKMHYRLDTGKLGELIIKHNESTMLDSHFVKSDKPTLCKVETPQCTTESTSESTTENFTPSSGEKPPQKEPESFEDLFPEPEPTPRRTAAQAVEQLQIVAGTDPLSGALKALETASEKPTTIPAAAGGADPWEKVADMFCGLHGLRLVDVRETDRKNWPRKLQSIAETARATPAQMIKAIRALPDSEYHFKSYSSPYMRSFEPDIIMLVSQMAAGQDVRVKGNGHGTHSRNNGGSLPPPPAGRDSVEEIQRKLAERISQGG